MALRKGLLPDQGTAAGGGNSQPCVTHKSSSNDALPVTARGCVDQVFTDMAVIDVRESGFVLREIAERASVNGVNGVNAAPTCHLDRGQLSEEAFHPRAVNPPDQEDGNRQQHKEHRQEPLERAGIVAGLGAVAGHDGRRFMGYRLG